MSLQSGPVDEARERTAELAEEWMEDFYIGEIRAVCFNFAPAGWALCDGSTYPIAQYTTLFQLIGWTYGGDGATTFGVPDLRGRGLIHYNTATGGLPKIGTSGGSERVGLSGDENAAHTHVIQAQHGPGTNMVPDLAFFAAGIEQWANSAEAGEGTAEMLVDAGKSAAHENRMPYMVLNYIIALSGPYPKA